MSVNKNLADVSSKTIVEALMRVIADGIITIDRSGIIQTVNPATEQIFGYKADEMIGNNVKMLMPESYAKEHDGYLQNYLTTGIKKIIGVGREVTGKRKNGKTFPLELAISDMQVDGKQMFAGIVRDISERRRVDDELTESTKRLALATEAGCIGVWEYDVATGNLVWDDRMFELYGISRKQFSGAYDAWKHALHPDDLEAAENNLNNAIETGLPFDAEFRIKWPSGELRYIQAHAQVIKEADNKTHRVIGVNTDITTTKQAILESLAREKRIRALIDTIVDGIIVITNRGNMLSLNPAAEKLFGYSQEELLNKNIKMLMPEPYQSAHDGYLKNYQDTGQKKIIGSGREVVGKRKDGTTFPMELAVSEAEVAGEQLFTGIVRDISERKATFAQQRLQSGALEAAANAILITDLRGIIQWANSAFTRLTGYYLDEVIGKTPNILKSGQHTPQFYNELWQTVKEGRVWQGEVVNKRKDGSLYTEEQTITPLTSEKGQLTHFIAIKLDVSQRKAAEADLAEKSKALEVVAEFERTQTKIMALFNSFSDTQEIFKQMLNLLARNHDFPISAVYLFDEWQGRLNCAASYGLPEDFNREITIGSGIVGQAAQSGQQTLLKSSQDMPFKIDTGLFSISPTIVIATPITYSSKVLGVMVLSSIKTLNNSELSFIDRLASQVGVSLNNQSQYQHLKALSEQLKHRGKEISQKNAQLEQSNRLKTEFLANMSHELRTPLNAIIGFSEVLKDQLLGELNTEQDDYVLEIFESAKHLLSLINDILDLSKIEAGKMTLHLEVVNLPEMLQNSLSIVKETAHKDNIKLSLTVADDLLYVQIDSRKLKQILFNLLSNAVKFTPEGGLVSIEATSELETLSIKVTDTGIGIGEDEIKMLFQPFVQLDGSLSRHYEGTGLGLAMVKRLVELHQGSVRVTSEKGKGSCFECLFPYKHSQLSTDNNASDEHYATITNGAAEKAANSQVGSDVEPNVASTLTPEQPQSIVLVVESDENSSQFFKQQLERAGYQVLRAKNQLDALQIARTSLPHLIVLDLMLTDVDGLSLIQALKTDDLLKEIPVVPIASSADKHVQLGMMDVLQKPVYKQPLLDSVDSLLSLNNSISHKIMVVDDDTKAVQFLTEQLEAAGFITIPAYGGQQAIDVAVSASPDLIILDLMMPEVNGFEVIAQLRKNTHTRDIPVIILTAKILDQQDKQRLTESVHQIIDKSGFETDHFLSQVQAKLPPQTSNKPDTKDPKHKRSTTETSLLILIIEDDKKQADLLKLYLEDAGYQIQIADNGREGLILMQQCHPDLITLDLLMPVMDGIAFLDSKNSMPGYRDIPVIVLSTNAEQTIEESITAEAVMTKPIQRAEMLKLVNDLLPIKSNSQQTRKLLLIDDDPKSIKMISSYLTGSQLQIFTALSGTDGIEQANLENPDLIILDLMMPEMSGFEVLSILKNNTKTQDIPVIILTAKILTQEDRETLLDQVAAISEKGKSNRESLTQQINNIFNRYH
jgi:PAS domain S-box-containing protein